MRKNRVDHVRVVLKRNGPVLLATEKALKATDLTRGEKGKGGSRGITPVSQEFNGN